MGRQHALDIGQAPRWIQLIRLNLIGTTTSNAVQGTQIPNFRNPYLAYDGNDVKRAPDGEVVIAAGFNKREVLQQDLRRDRLLAEIDRICHIYDIRNVSEPDDERFYEAVQQIIFKNNNFFEPGIARILHTEDHPLHIRTLVAVYGLIALAAEQERNAKGLYEKTPIGLAPHINDSHVFKILVFDPVRDFSSDSEKDALAINPWSQLRNPRRVDPTDLTSPFSHPKTLPEPVVVRISGLPTLRKIFTAFWVEYGARQGATAGPRLLPSHIIGYTDWDPAVKPKDHGDLWPQKLVTGGYQPIGAERHFNVFLENQTRTHRIQGKDRPDSTWLGFLMHTPQSAASSDFKAQSQSWPNLIACFGELAHYEAYAPWKLPLFRDHRGKTAQQRMDLFGITTTLRGKRHPAEAPPQLEPARDAEVFAELPTMATSGPMQQFYDKLDTALILERNKIRQELLDKINLELGEHRSAAMAKRDSKLAELEEENKQNLQVLEAKMEKRRLAHREQVEKLNAEHQAELEELTDIRMGLAEGNSSAVEVAKEKIKDILYKGVDYSKLTEAFIQEHRASLKVSQSTSSFSGFSPSSIGRTVASSIANSFPGRLLFPPSKEQHSANRKEELRRQVEKVDDEISLALIREGWAAEILKGLREKKETLDGELRAMDEEKKREEDLEEKKRKEEAAAQIMEIYKANGLTTADLGNLTTAGDSTKKRSAAEVEDLETNVGKKSRTHEDDLREARAGKKPESIDDEPNNGDQDKEPEAEKKDGNVDLTVEEAEKTTTTEQLKGDTPQNDKNGQAMEEDVAQDRTKDSQEIQDDQQSKKPDNSNLGGAGEKVTIDPQAQDTTGTGEQTQPRGSTLPDVNRQASAEGSQRRKSDLRDSTRYYCNKVKEGPRWKDSKAGSRLVNPRSGKYLFAQKASLSRKHPRKLFKKTDRSLEKLRDAKARGWDTADIYSEDSYVSDGERSPSPEANPNKPSPFDYSPSPEPPSEAEDKPATRYHLGAVKKKPTTSGFNMPLTVAPSGKYLEHQRALLGDRGNNLRQTFRTIEKASLAEKYSVREEDVFSEYSFFSDTEVE